ncbi:helicase [Pseudoalteromonas phenolica]|uniref:Helicase n=1 Tax=Pseudoalteromonas phenolica TaxID=161398 RepID=A0A5S3YTA9_9GAMM|nr:DEAD/DEAH box helicase family protein [Pseudoalteromonas phenolica]TMP80578.1 helicase [Pseudoalteromonas phenolica]
MNFFLETPVNIEGNKRLRAPQIEAYLNIQEYFRRSPDGEALVVLPTGTGKSGLVSIAPFGCAKGRVLIITPGLVTKDSIRKTQEALYDNFWVNFDIVFNPKHIPNVCEYHTGISDEHLAESHIVYSNIQKLSANRKMGLLNRVDSDFFDMVIIDEAHHAPAESWREVLDYFSKAKKLHVTGTPYRGDGQLLPGEKIHETQLSEVMRDRYVKWLRKETVNAHELYFTVSDAPERKLSKMEVLALKDKEWLEKSVALSEACSKDVINSSLEKLKELRTASPNVPHKILAVGCSIAHAEDLTKWYASSGVSCVIVHSEMHKDELKTAFQKIDSHECQVVISVNMLMEGYDHHYLSILAIFRPYRSINAFAQIVGRVLRAIPQNEIKAFEIDNNAVVIFHEETGLNVMWEKFQKEVERAKQKVKDYSRLSDEYSERSASLASVSSEGAFVSEQDSYLNDIDFNELFNSKRSEIDQKVESQMVKMREAGIDEIVIQSMKNKLKDNETNKVSEDIDPELIEKRPDLARKKIRELLTKRTQDETANLLSDYNYDEKGLDLAPKFDHLFNYPLGKTPNDGVLVKYINLKLAKKFKKVGERDNKTLLESLNFIPKLMDELRKMLSR